MEKTIETHTVEEEEEEEETVPIFNNYYYNLTKVTEDTVLHIHYMSFKSFLVKKSNSLKSIILDIDNMNLCMKHNISKMKVSDCCVDFLKYKYSIVLTYNTDISFVLPPPFIWTTNITYFVKMIKLMLEDNNRIDLVKRIYSQFMKSNFKIGEIESIKSKKTSFMRNNILATRGNSIRMTLTMDMMLGPHYIAIADNIYNTLDLETNMVIINRAPSINSTCVYVCEMLTFDDPTDMTVHINPWIAEGLHADADGDELPIYYIKKEGNMCGFEIEMAVAEMKRISWKYGQRTDIINNSRYHFPQHYKYLTYKYNEEFMKNRFYNRIKTMYPMLSHNECLEKMMAIGCTIMKEEFDNLIDYIIDFQKTVEFIDLSFKEIFNGQELNDIVKSGAKGTQGHIQEFLNSLKHTDNELDDDYKKKLIDSFNKYVDNGNKIKQEGMSQFKYLQGFVNITYNDGDLMSNDHVLVENIAEGFQLFSSCILNSHAVEYMFDDLVFLSKEL